MPEQVVTYKGRTFSIVLLLIIGVLAILLWWKSCGGSKGIDPQVVAQMKAESDAAYNKLLDHANAIEDTVKDLRGEKELADSMLSDAAKDLEKMFQENARLRLRHEKEKPIESDHDSLYYCSYGYIKDCDTCFLNLKKIEDTVKSVKRVIEQREAINQKIISLKDREIASLKEATKVQHDNYSNLLIAYSKAGTPKRSFSGGIEFSYSQPVKNIGAYLQFRTRDGKEFSVSAGGNTLSAGYISGRIGMKIF